MATAQDMITGALRLIGVVAGGETPSTDDLTDGLAALNELLDNWKTQHLAVFTIVRRFHTMTMGTGSYTIGTGADIDAPRPVKIESAGIIQANGLRSEMVMISAKEYAAIAEKSGALSKQPLMLYNDNDYPVSNLTVWPAPIGTPTLDLYVWEELEGPLALADPLNMPPAYARAVRFNLALTLAPEYGKDPGQVVIAIAQQSKAELGGLNASNNAAQEDPPTPPPAPVNNNG